MAGFRYIKINQSPEALRSHGRRCESSGWSCRRALSRGERAICPCHVQHQRRKSEPDKGLDGNGSAEIRTGGGCVDGLRFDGNQNQRRVRRRIRLGACERIQTSRCTHLRWLSGSLLLLLLFSKTSSRSRYPVPPCVLISPHQSSLTLSIPVVTG